MYFDTRAVKRDSFYPYLDDFRFLQCYEHRYQRSVFRPSVCSLVDCAPFSVLLMNLLKNQEFMLKMPKILKIENF